MPTSVEVDLGSVVTSTPVPIQDGIALRTLDRIAETLVVVALLGELVMVLVNVFARAYLHHSFLWADELACWQRAQPTWDLSMLALRAGTNPQALITTTPRRVAVLRRILGEASTVQTTESTYANKAHLPREFLDQIVSLYEKTRLGRQEIYAEFLESYLVPYLSER